MKSFAIIFMLILVVVPMMFIGKTKKNENTKDEANKTTFELQNFKYSEMNASGLSLIVLGGAGYYFENGDAKVAPFTLYRLDANITEKLSSKVATKRVPKLDIDGDVLYERSDGIVIKTQKATYDEVGKTMVAEPIYAKIEVRE